MKITKRDTIVFILATTAAVVCTGWWKTPETKRNLESDILYSWLTGDDTRVDIAIQENELTLYVGDHAQSNPVLQLVVKGGELQIFDQVKNGNNPDDMEGVNLTTNKGKLTSFIITKTTSGKRAFYTDENKDLLPDTRKVTGEPKEQIIWHFHPESDNQNQVTSPH